MDNLTEGVTIANGVRVIIDHKMGVQWSIVVYWIK